MLLQVSCELHSRVIQDEPFIASAGTAVVHRSVKARECMVSERQQFDETNERTEKCGYLS